ncbi:MAG: hypothetical protein F4156_17000, partial [Holophagales bacterium]|nr:hypothetical protein [Holophagales bacterium]
MVPRRHDAELWRKPGARRRPPLALLTACVLPVSPAIAQSAPQVTGIEITSDPGSSGFYTDEDLIEVTVTFDQNVSVWTSGGYPSVDIRIGDVARRAGLQRSRDDWMVFSYQVHVGGYPPEAATMINHHHLQAAHGGEEDLDGVSIEAGSISLNGGTITNASNQAALLTHPGLAVQPGHKVDSIRPVFSRPPVVNGDTVTVFYREPLDSTGSPRTSDTTVRAISTEVRNWKVTNAVVAGNELRLTLDQPVEHDDAVVVNVSYTSEIRDPAGQRAFGGGGTAMNQTPEPEPASAEGPTVTALAFDSTPSLGSIYRGGESVDIKVTFDGEVTVTTSDGTPSLQLKVGGLLRTAHYVSGSGTTELTFRYETSEGLSLPVATFLTYHWRQTVATGDEDSDGLSVPAGRLRLNGGTITGSGGDADLDHPELPADARHKVDGVKPLLAGTPEADGNVVTLNFSEALDQSSTPDSGAFQVQARRADRDRRVLTASVDGSTVELVVLPPLIHGERLWVTYTPGAAAIQDLRGNTVPSVPLSPIVNHTTRQSGFSPDSGAASVGSVGIGSTPGTDGIYAGGDRIDIDVAFDGDVTVDTTNGDPLLELEVGGLVEHAAYRTGSGTSALTFSYDIAEGWPPGMGDQIRSAGVIARIGDLDTDGVRVPAGEIELNGATIIDGSSRNANLTYPALGPQPGHRVDGVRPYVLPGDSVVHTSTIAVAFSEALKTGSPDLTGFTVEADGDRTVAAVSVAGSTITLTVTPPLRPGEQATVTYTPGSDPIRDLAGNPAFDAVFKATVRSGGGGG